MKHYILILLSLAILISCNKPNNDPETDDLKKKELELKEKELQIRESEMLERKRSELDEKENKLRSNESTNNRTNLSGSYYGTIKDGTSWKAYISSFDGENFSGHNVIYWDKYPDGYRTNFTGSYNSFTNRITMSEDRNTKGAGKFTGTVSDDGASMSGEWYRYSDNGTFTWNLTKEN